jgi:Na+-driven multidrug efflux pump
LIFTIAVLLGGDALYSAMGGSGGSLAAANTYSTVIFSGAVLVWLFNSLANVIRGTGNMVVPALVTCTGVAVLIPLSPCLIFGWGPFPRLGVAGGAAAVLIYYAAGSAAFAFYLRSGRSVVRLQLTGIRLRAALFRHSARRRGRGTHHSPDQSHHRDCDCARWRAGAGGDRRLRRWHAA